MQLWEYLFIRAIYQGNTLCPLFVNGSEIRDPVLRSASVYDYAQDLGAAGWEVVSVEQGGERFVFKRPKQEAGGARPEAFGDSVA